MKPLLTRSSPHRARDPREVPLTPAAQQPEIVALEKQRAALESRLAETLARKQRAKKPTNAKRTALDRARDLVSGGYIPGVDSAAELRATAEEEMVLVRAIAEVETQISDVLARLSLEVSQNFQPDHIAALRQLDIALASVSDAVGALHGIQARIQAAGYHPRSDILPAAIPRSAYLVGKSQAFGSEAATFRRWLIAKFGE